MKTIYDLYKDDSEDGMGRLRKVISADSMVALSGWVRTKHPDAVMESNTYGTSFKVGNYLRYEVRPSVLVSVDDLPEMANAVIRLAAVKTEREALHAEEQALISLLGDK